MPYLLLAIGAILGLYGLYKFFLNATPKQAGTLVLSMAAMGLTAALLILTLTGRLPLALAALVALWPVAISVWKSRTKSRNAAPTGKAMTRQEALNILGLNENSGATEIQEAYKRLMMKIHPDQQGSEWMAAKLNEARDFLLK